MAQKFDAISGRIVANVNARTIKTVWNKLNVKRYPREAVYAENVENMFWYTKHGHKMGEVSTTAMSQQAKHFSTVASPAAAGGKIPVRTRLANGLVMGEYGPCSEKIKRLQEEFAKDDGLLVWQKRPSDKMVMTAAYTLFVVCLGTIGFNVYMVLFGSSKKK